MFQPKAMDTIAKSVLNLVLTYNKGSTEKEILEGCRLYVRSSIKVDDLCYTKLMQIITDQLQSLKYRGEY
jgi:hypothetical protein